MNEERELLHHIHASPGDESARLVYADWLESRGDPRAVYVRTDPELRRFSVVAWIEATGQLESYGKAGEESFRQEHRAELARRQHHRELAASLDPAWVALFDFLSCPFEPFYFPRHADGSRCLEPEALPLLKVIGTRGAIMTFASDLRTGVAWDEDLTRDLRFLRGLELDECAYGSATCPLHPFLCELEPTGRPLTGADVLAALQPRRFHNPHIPTLDAEWIAFPNSQGQSADEIHNDFAGQHVFPSRDEEDEEPLSPSEGAHGVLQSYVRDGKLWYVLLHDIPAEGDEYSRYVVLFAVGLSPAGDRLLGAVTHQLCHNLCD
jgi:uncharacterized protein (TIGR02996 family)